MVHFEIKYVVDNFMKRLIRDFHIALKYLEAIYKTQKRTRVLGRRYQHSA